MTVINILRPLRFALLLAMLAIPLYFTFDAGVQQGHEAVEGVAPARAAKDIADAQQAASAGDVVAAALSYGRAVGASQSPETLFAAGEFFAASKNYKLAAKVLEDAAQSASTSNPSLEKLIRRKLDDYRSQAARSQSY